MKPCAVESGAAAITALAEASSQGLPFALVLLDANMPGMDGFAVAEQMAAHPELGGVPIMMLTSSDQFGDSTRCRELGIRAYLTKPIRHADLFDACCQALQAQAPRRSDPRICAHDTPMVRAHVLLAEDNLVNQRVAAGLLIRRGHTVEIVNNGTEAVAAMRSHAYEVVLMDIQMPEMGGIEATRAIREWEASTGRHSRIVALTAHAMAGDRERYLEAGMDGYLSKPIDPDALFAVVERRPPLADRRPADGESPLAVQEMRRRLGDDDEFVAEVMAMFLVDCPARLAQLKIAVAARDREEIRSVAHALKGAAGNLSATAVSECASALESMAADGVFDQFAADAMYARLEAESARVIGVLDAGLVVSVHSVEP
jgi:two-component system sensor histidine kinase/response regulator